MCNTIFQYHTQNPEKRGRRQKFATKEHVVSTSTFKPRRTFGRFLRLWHALNVDVIRISVVIKELLIISLASWFAFLVSFGTIGNNIHISASSSAQFTFHIPKPWRLQLLPNNNRSIHHPFHHRRNNELNISNTFNHSPINLHKFVPSSSNVLELLLHYRHLHRNIEGTIVHEIYSVLIVSRYH